MRHRGRVLIGVRVITTQGEVGRHGAKHDLLLPILLGADVARRWLITPSGGSKLIVSLRGRLPPKHRRRHVLVRLNGPCCAPSPKQSTGGGGGILAIGTACPAFSPGEVDWVQSIAPFPVIFLSYVERCGI